MNLKKRNEKIKLLRSQGKTLAWISRQKGVEISPERIRQITVEPNKEKLYQYLELSYRTKLITKASYEWIKKEIEELSIPNRKKELVIRRRILIKHLIDQLGFTVSQVSSLLDKHPTSINHLYSS